MGRVYKSALGKVIDMDLLRLSNEEVIAVGNMKVNARGDQLGAGGEVIKTRNEVMGDYYKLNTPVIESSSAPPVNEQEMHRLSQEAQASRPSTMRGNLANSLVKPPQKKDLEDQEGNI